MDQQFFDFVDGSISLLAGKKSRLDNLLIDVIDYLQKRVIEKIGLKNVTINGRVKGTTSLPEKIIRKNYYSKYRDPVMFVRDLPDILGVRIICLLNNEEAHIFGKLKEIFCHKKIDDQGYLCDIENITEINHLLIKDEPQPQMQKNGKDIYRITCKWFDKTNNEYINVELQVKSLVHFFWGELEHMLFYKNYSYNISGEYYQNHMNTIEKDLNIIDLQLSSLKFHLMKTEEAKVQEIKQIAALLLSSTYNSCIREYLKCDIDLREIYDIIADIHFYKVKGNEEIIPRLNGILEKAKNLKLDQIDFSNRIPCSFDRDVEGDERFITEEINICVSSNDVFWEMFYFLFKSINGFDEHNEIIFNISKGLLNLFRQFEEDLAEFSDIDSENDKSEIIKQAIYEGIGKAFKQYRKIDFFLYKSHLKDNLRLIRGFINKFNNKLSEAKDKELNENRQLLSEFIYVLLITSIKKELLTNELENLNKLAEENNLLEIDIERLQDLISKKCKFSKDEILLLMGFTGEGL